MKFEKSIRKQLNPSDLINKMSRTSHKGLTSWVGYLLFHELESPLHWHFHQQVFTPVNDQLKNEI